MGRQPPWLWLSLFSARAHVIPIPFAVLHRMRGDERLAVGAEEQASQQIRLLGSHARPMLAVVGGKPSLHGREGLSVDDRLVLTFVLLVVVHDLARIDRVGKDLVQMPAAERPVAPRLVACGRERSGAD